MASKIRAAVILLMIGGVIFLAVDYASKVAGAMYRKGSSVKRNHGLQGKNMEQDLSMLLQGKGLSEDEQEKLIERAYIKKQTMVSFLWIFVILFVGGMLLLVFKEPKVETEEDPDKLFKPPSIVKTGDSWEEDASEMEEDLFKQGMKKDQDF